MATVNQIMNYTESSATFYVVTTCIQQKRKDCSTLTATHILIILLFVCGVFFAIIMYWKTCGSICRLSQSRCSEHSALQNEHNNESEDSSASQCYTIYESRDSPPSYSDVCSAPPLYGCPFNRASMLEPPPIYPETPKSSDKVSRATNQALPIWHHI